MEIRRIIKKQGLTTQEVANRMGVTLSALNQSISGNPSVKVLEKIASALNVPVWQLFISPEEIEQNKITALIKYNGQLFEVHTVEELKQFAASL